MLYKVNAAVYPEMHKEHESKTCEQNVEFLSVDWR